MLSWLSKIRLWEIALSVFLGFGCYLLWTASRSDEQLTVQTSKILTHADSTLTNVDGLVAQVGPVLTGVTKTVSQTEKDISQVTTPLAGVVSGLKQSVALVNNQCVPGPCGTLADINKTLGTFRLTAGQLEIAANHEDKNLTNLDGQEDQLYADTHQAIMNFNLLLASPDLVAAIKNSATITNNLGQTTADFQTKFHAFLFPPPCKGWKCHIKDGYEALKIGSQFAEPAYWGWALVNRIKP